MDEAVICFGRFNPLHIGHEYMFKKLNELATEKQVKPFIIVITGGSRGDSSWIKQRDLREIIEKNYNVAVHFARNSFEGAEMVKDDGFLVTGVICGSDRKDEYPKMLQRVYGEALINIPIEQLVIQRDSNQTKHASSTKMRQCVKRCDFTSFCLMAPRRINSVDYYFMLRGIEEEQYASV